MPVGRLLRFSLLVIIPSTDPHSLIIPSSTLYGLDTENVFKYTTYKISEAEVNLSASVQCKAEQLGE
jgi:hypothetical protein